MSGENTSHKGSDDTKTKQTMQISTRLEALKSFNLISLWVIYLLCCSFIYAMRYDGISNPIIRVFWFGLFIVCPILVYSWTLEGVEQNTGDFFISGLLIGLWSSSTNHRKIPALLSYWLKIFQNVWKWCEHENI